MLGREGGKECEEILLRSARIVLVNSKHYSIRTRFLSHNL